MRRAKLGTRTRKKNNKTTERRWRPGSEGTQATNASFRRKFNLNFRNFGVRDEYGGTWRTRSLPAAREGRGRVRHDPPCSSTTSTLFKTHRGTENVISVRRGPSSHQVCKTRRYSAAPNNNLVPQFTKHVLRLSQNVFATCTRRFVRNFKSGSNKLRVSC